MRRLALLFLVLAAGPGCDGGRVGSDAETPPLVVATLYPVASVVGAIGGGAVSVRTLLPPGADLHSYEPTPRDAEALAGADLVVRIGGAADSWLEVEAPEVVFAEGLELAGETHGEAGTGNPHVWLDPIRVRDVLVPRVARALVRLVPDSTGAIRSRAAAFTDSLTALDREIRELLGRLPERRFTASHPAWIYFADRYGLEPIGTLHADPGGETGIRALARLVDAARAHGARAVIAEPQLGPAGVAALADELDARVEVADPLGGPGIEGRRDYLELMRFNARAFARALGGERP